MSRLGPWRQNIDRRDINSEGHDVKWEWYMRDPLLSLRRFPFKKRYWTHCPVTPTEWLFKMRVLEVRLDGSCELEVLLERVDSHDIELEGSVWIDICDPDDNLIFPKVTFHKGGMLQGHSIEETINIRPRPNMRQALFGRMVIYVTVMVCFCHGHPEDSD